MVETDPGPLRVEREPGHLSRKLLRDLNVQCLDVPVPADFSTDYSSIPALCRPLVQWSKVDVAGVVHDYCFPRQSRREDDQIWHLLARSGEWSAGPIQAWLGWVALRAFGSFSRSKAPEHRPGWLAVVVLIALAAIVWASALIYCLVPPVK